MYYSDVSIITIVDSLLQKIMPAIVYEIKPTKYKGKLTHFNIGTCNT